MSIRTQDADIVVVGGGSAGCALVGRLCRAGSGRVVLIEAGPDYGPAGSSRWPKELLDPTSVPATHQWSLAEERDGGRLTQRARARVIGGCSAHNECGATWPAPEDFDAWAGLLGDPRWSFAALRPLLDVIEDARGTTAAGHGRGGAVPTEPYQYDRLAAIQRAFFDACVVLGFPADGISRAGAVGLGRANIVKAIRWNAAFAFLDPVRGCGTLTIMDNVTVDRLLLRGRRATGVLARSSDGIEIEVGARRVVLCAGTFGSPSILLRSGIGPAADLEAQAIPVTIDLPGVGQNLQEHPGIALRYAVDGAALQADLTAGRLSHWQAGLQATGAEGARLAVFPYQVHEATGDWETSLMAFLLNPVSRGHVSLGSAAPGAPTRINPRYLSDAGDHDARALQEAFHLLRRIAETEPLASCLLQEADESRQVQTDQEIEAFVQANVMPYEHAAGTCRMGHPDDPGAVTTSEGRVRGLENVMVADASIMPVLPPVPINLTCMLIGWRMAEAVLRLGDENASRI